MRSNADLTLDGNAIGGLLAEAFGDDMTGVRFHRQRKRRVPAEAHGNGCHGSTPCRAENRELCIDVPCHAALGKMPAGGS